jgi:hypothetical protein
MKGLKGKSGAAQTNPKYSIFDQKILPSRLAVTASIPEKKAHRVTENMKYIRIFRSKLYRRCQVVDNPYQAQSGCKKKKPGVGREKIVQIKTRLTYEIEKQIPGKKKKV